jgi:hypothetical protein
MTMLKHFILAIMLVTLVGCGCGDTPPTVAPGSQVTSFSARTALPPCEVPYTPEVVTPVQPIDIVFVMDDSLFFNAANGMGIVPKNDNDNRSRSLVAQRIFGDLRARLKAAVAARQAAGTLPAGVNFDFAYSVVRYEDFGGATVPYQTATGTIDAGARPYILNMPLLREERPDFQAAFDAALARTATDGDGNPTVNGLKRQDPQTAFEALWQIANGTGFDGNGANGTLDNGSPCSANAQGTDLKVFTDIPAVQFALTGADPQNPVWNEYVVQDEAGNSEAGCISSGNIGGVGFRPDSLRWVILASDIATVAPFEDAAGTPQVPPAGTRVFPDLATANPFVPAPAFDGITGRYGAADGGPSSVAPVGAASAQETITRLNELGIEVMALGAPGVQPGPVKPNLPGAIPGDAIDAVLLPQNPAFTPYTSQSAFSILTGSQISDDTPGGLVGLFPAVFNLGNVGLLDTSAADPLVPTSFATTVTDDLLNGILERIEAKATAGGTGGGTGGGPIPPLPTLTLRVQMQVDDSGFTQPIQRLAPQPSSTVSATINVPVYYRNTLTNETFYIDGAGNQVPYSPPALIDVPFPDWSFDRIGDVVVPITDLAPFSVMVTADPGTAIGNIQPGVNDDAVAFLQRKIGQTEGPLAVGQGVMEITIHPSPLDAPLPRGMTILPGYTGWCLTLQDTPWGAAQVFGAEAVGVCSGLFPVAP